MISLITSFFYHHNINRMNEYIHTLKKNLKMQYIYEIHIFITPNDHEKFKNDEEFCNNDLKNYISKIKFIISEKQPTYKDFIEFCMRSDMSNKFCMISNSDIELRNIDEKLIKDLKDKKLGYILTRHESDGSKPLIDNYKGSHDSIIFYSNNLKENFEKADDPNLEFINITQNNGGSEALMTWWLIKNMNFTLLNPCFQIKIVHHHASKIRDIYRTVAYTWDTKLGRGGFHNPYMIRPTTIE